MMLEITSAVKAPALKKSLFQIMQASNTEQINQKGDDLTINLGDIFYGSWGYEQTNIDFVKVVGISKSGKSVKVKNIGQKTVSVTNSMSETVAPDPENEIEGTEVTVRISQSCMDSEVILRGSYFYTKDSKHLGSLYRYKHPIYQSHYA